MDLTNLQKNFEEAVKRHHVAGACIAVYYDAVLVTAAAGVTNVTTGVRMTADTVIHLNSIAKIFNATLVMQLIDEGLLRLDDPVVKYLPALKLHDVEARECITVKMLLNHTSGIDGELLPDCGHDLETIEKAISRFTNMGQIHKPGLDCSYCNTGTVIAGYLAQKISGVSWYDLVKERIFVPLRMDHSVVLPEDALLHRASVGHYLNPITLEISRSSLAFLPLSFAPAGSTMMMSVRDLVTFARAHIADGVGPNGKRILSEQGALAMRQLTTHCHIRNVRGMGLGWMLFNNGVIGHSGNSAGNASMLYVHPEKKIVVAILTNTEHGLVLINDFMRPWLKEIADIRPYGDMEQYRRPTKDVAVHEAQYIGVYENNALRCEVCKIASGLGLAIQTKFYINDNNSEGKPVFTPLIAMSKKSFALGPRDKQAAADLVAQDEISFHHFDSEGRPHSLILKGRLLMRAKI